MKLGSKREIRRHQKERYDTTEKFLKKAAAVGKTNMKLVRQLMKAREEEHEQVD